MPSDQLIEIPPGARLRRLPISAVLLLFAVTCFIAAALVPVIALRYGLLIAGGISLLLALLLAARHFIFGRLNEDLTAAATLLIAKDADSAFVTDAACIVQGANGPSQARFGQTTGQTMRQVLGTLIAQPDGLMRRVKEHVAAGGHSKEDIVTHSGHFRLSVSAIGDGAMLWRLDDLEDTRYTPLGTANINLPHLQISATGTVAQINDAARRLLGGRPKTLSDVIEDLPVRAGQVHKIKTTGNRTTAVVAEVTGRGGDCDIYLLPDTGTTAPRKFNAGWDAIEDLPVPLMKISPDGEILASNREARQLLNLQDTAGKRMADVLDGLGRPINDWLREAAEGRGGNVSQFLRGRSENQDTFVQVTLNISGETADTHLIAVLNDVTELKTLEAQFVQSQKMQAIGQLAGGVAHDFNNLLTAISGHCDLLLLRHDEGDQNYGDLIQIHQNANRAASLVGQLLAFSRKQNLQPEIIDLRDTLSDLTHLLNRLVGEKVTLLLNHDPALAQIKADRRQLEQVLMNLVVNARDAMPKGGEIRVVTENLSLKTQMVKDRAIVPPGEYVVVKVIDEGHGIPAEKLPKIFEPFYTTKRVGEGTGLGLSTAYGIVKQTGGYIFAESEVDKGTQFSLLFPSYDLPVAEPLEVATSAPQPINTEAEGVVLLVEDEAPVRAFASRALRLRGYTVLEADCAEAALEMLNDTELGVDIFVTDVIMPGMDGPTWVREALVDRPDTKVVFVSGYAEDAFGDDQSRIPNSVFLPKPFSLNALTQTVQGQLQDRRMTA